MGASSTFYCYGDQSCAESDLYFTSSSSGGANIEARGFKSVAYSTLYLDRGTDINAYGAFSMYQSVISMYNDGTYIDAQAPFALSGADLLCEDYELCEIECGGFGCFNISSATGTGIYGVYCDNNMVSNILCPDVTSFATDIENELISIVLDFEDKMDNFDIGEEMCLSSENGALGINCGDEDECTSMTSSYVNKGVCCSGYNSCENPYLSILMTSSLLNVSDTDSIGFRCGGYQSCWDTSEYSSGVDYLSILGRIVNYNNMTGQTIDIHCGGYQSCYDMTMTGANNVVCSAFESCVYSRVSEINSLFVAGDYGIEDGAVWNTTGDVYCFARGACYNTIFTNIGGNIYGLGKYALNRVEIFNTMNNSIIDTIYIYGQSAGVWSTIENVNQLYARGWLVVTGAQITGIRTLFAHGDRCLSRALITTGLTISDTSVDNQVIIKIAGNNTDPYDVICSVGDVCSIYCQTTTSCTLMNLTCFGTCNVYCGSSINGNDCPGGNDDTINYSPTSSPQINPTAMPTEPVPTRDPTEPSPAPSAAPTDPTQSPTIETTNDYNAGDSVTVFGDNLDNNLSLFVTYVVGCGLFAIFFAASLCHLKKSTVRHTRALNNHENKYLRADLTMCNLLSLLYNTERSTLGSIAFETLDVVSGIFLAITLIQKNKDYNNTSSSTDDKNLYHIGMVCLFCAILGIICLGVKIHILKSIYVVIKYKKTQQTIWYDKAPQKTQGIKDIVLKLENGKEFIYTEQFIRRDVLMWDIFTSAVEDLPQALIALTVLVVYSDSGVTMIAVMCLLISVLLLLWKIARLCMNYNGCGTGEMLDQVALAKELTREIELVGTKNHDGNGYMNDRGDNNNNNNNNMSGVQIKYGQQLENTSTRMATPTFVQHGQLPSTSTAGIY